MCACVSLSANEWPYAVCKQRCAVCMRACLSGHSDPFLSSMMSCCCHPWWPVVVIHDELAKTFSSRQTHCVMIACPGRHDWMPHVPPSLTSLCHERMPEIRLTVPSDCHMTAERMPEIRLTVPSDCHITAEHMPEIRLTVPSDFALWQQSARGPAGMYYEEFDPNEIFNIFFGCVSCRALDSARKRKCDSVARGLEVGKLRRRSRVFMLLQAHAHYWEWL